MTDLPSKDKSLCWLRFLNARAEVIDWFRSEFEYTDEEAAQHLSMDPVQVRLIRERDRRLDVASPETPEEHPTARAFRDLADAHEAQGFSDTIGFSPGALRAFAAQIDGIGAQKTGCSGSET